MRKISLGVRSSVLALLAVVAAGCGGGGGGGSGGASASVAPAPSDGTAIARPAAAPPTPSIAGPSILVGGAAAKFEGASLPAGNAVTIFVRYPDGRETSVSAMVGDDGRLSQTLVPTGEGVHVVRMVDSSGRELATTNFIAQ
jgi:hypothetical protein